MSIILDNVQKRYGQRAVVNGVNLKVDRGEIVGLLGPNGAGKTTTFYITTGLVRPNYGKVWLEDREITSLAIDRRARLGIGYLPQQPSIFRNLTVAENIQLVLEQTVSSPKLRRMRQQELLHDFQLEKVANTKGSQVSGGERRRTEIARALAVGTEGPQFLLLDEPFAGIDPIAVGEIQKIIASLRDRHMGILITDHNVRETLEITDRAYIMRDGEIFAKGNSAELYQNSLVKQYYLGEKFKI
ncbi:MAG: LPS export ABC transporter ATP-binding protein [Prochloraceae cyanobacterium]|nr:LPS export ABC transporter ATP-binding protein [Prochloraceae cyanobacterium]